MPKRTYTYVDNSNVFIEGQRVSAVAKGMAIDIQDALYRRIFDTSWQLDYGKLHEFCTFRELMSRWGERSVGE